MSYAEKIISSQNKLIYKIQEKTGNGHDVWMIVSVMRSKLSLFLNMPKGCEYNPSNYGKVLKWGYGALPDKILEEVKSSYS